MFRNVVSGLVRQRVALNGIQRRTFAGGHAVKKDWTGIGEYGSLPGGDVVPSRLGDKRL